MLAGPAMTSTYLGYKIYANDMTKSLARVAVEPQVANDQKYFEANIGKVKTVDDFLNNYRLFTYAMKAYGLQDLGNAKALMKQVLESNLSDTTSVANRLNDSRYRSFAKAFNFTAKGAIASSGSLQTNAQLQDTLTRMNLDNSQVASVESSLSSVSSVASFEANDGLYTRVLSAYGLDPNTTTKSDVTAALESDLSNPNSFANRPGNSAFLSLAEGFNFASDGSIGGQRLLQSSQNIAATQSAYMSQIPADADSQAAAQTESAYYAKTLPTLTSVDQVLADPRLVSYIKTAFSVDSNVTTAQLRGVLTSNMLDPSSVANTFGIDLQNPPTSVTNYQLLATAFSIGTDGQAWDHGSVISTANLTTMTAAYTKAIGTDVTAAAAGATETQYVQSSLLSIKSVDGLLADDRIVSYMKTAFALPDATTDDLRNILRSNLLDPNSTANTLGGNARKLAAAFNFTPNGLVYSQRPIENATNITATTTAYMNLAGTSPPAKAAAQTETDYFTSTISRIKSVDDLLSDKRLVTYLTKAYALPATGTATLRQVLTSNLLDPKSKANTMGGGFQTLAAAFDISSDGTITHAADKQVQSKASFAATHMAYLEQTLETEAGNDNPGVQLALYFQRMAPNVTTAYQILADKALTKVVQTMLGLSSNSSNADIDSQAHNITAKLNLADFKDPAKLDKMVARFSALYDLTNTDSSS